MCLVSDIFLVWAYFVDEVLVSFCEVVAREFEDRLLLALGIVEEHCASLLLALDDTIAIVDAHLAELYEVEIFLVILEQFRLGLSEVHALLEVGAQFAFQLIGVKREYNL